MTRSSPIVDTDRSAPRGALGRADLLRLLTERDRAGRADDPPWIMLDGIDATVGYARGEPPSAASSIVLPEAPMAPPAVAAASTMRLDRRVPRKVPFLFAITDRRRRDSGPVDQRRLERPSATPLRDDELVPRSPVRVVTHEELVPRSRLIPGLRRYLSAARRGPLDAARLVRDLAERKPLRRIPRATTTRWSPEMVVILDDSPRLRPYRVDMDQLAGLLLAQCGRGGVSLRVINGDPTQPWTDLLDHWSSSAEPPKERPWSPPAPGARVVMVTDLGLLRGAESPECRLWVDFAATLARLRLRPVALVPLGAEQIDTRPFHGIAILRWSPDARMRPERSHGAAISSTDLPGLAELVAMAAPMSRVDPPLLRALRRLNPASPHNAGLEGALWTHPDVEASDAAAVRPEAIEGHLDRLAELTRELAAEADSVRRRHHAHLPPELVHFDTWRWQSRRGVPIDPEVRDFFERLGATLDAQGSDPAWWRSASEVVESADERMRAEQPELFYPLFAKVSGRASRLGRAVAIGGSIDPAALSRERGGVGRRTMWLVHDLASGSLVLTAQPPRPGRIALGAPVEVDAGGVNVRVGRRARSRWLEPTVDGERIAPLDAAIGPISIETVDETVRVERVNRPRGAAGWGIRRGETYFETPSFGGLVEKSTAAPWFSSNEDRAHPITLGHAQLVSVEDPARRTRRAVGFDSFGVYADLTLTTPNGTATQRFRWIEPGEFWMGSPEGKGKAEPGRDSDEGPQHRVTITRGFWLGATTCSQALWRAVMGENRSWFQGDDRPVENVSWLDVERFLKRLAELVPGCVTELPTEAEWEYACRAGTETPFSFGGNVTPEQVNYDGNYPYAGGPKGLYRAETVAVGSLPANKWGLHEMHGNVLEWCADGKRTYTTAPEEDPRGPEGQGVSRVVRGGSWISFARWARSACRGAHVPGLAGDDLGFRFCLRSVESSRAEPGQVPPGGRVSPKPGERGDQSGAPEAPAQRKGPLRRIADKLRGKHGE